MYLAGRKVKMWMAKRGKFVEKLMGKSGRIPLTGVRTRLRTCHLKDGDMGGRWHSEYYCRSEQSEQQLLLTEQSPTNKRRAQKTMHNKPEVATEGISGM